MSVFLVFLINFIKNVLKNVKELNFLNWSLKMINLYNIIVFSNENMLLIKNMIIILKMLIFLNVFDL